MFGSRPRAVARLVPALLLAALLFSPAAPSPGQAQTASDTVWAWGDNGAGQLGDGTATAGGAPVQVGGLGGVTAISAGSYHSLALTSDGTVWAWGYNGGGQLGAETAASCGDPPGDPCNRIPVQVGGLAAAAAIAAGDYHSLALARDGTVWAWGESALGQLGAETTTACANPPGLDVACSRTPMHVGGLSEVAAISAGGFHSLALKADGSVWAWGYNDSGQLGVDTATACADSSGLDVPCSYAPLRVDGLGEIAAIAAGRRHSLALGQDGTVWAWGANSNGQLGDGTMIGHLKGVIQVDGLGDMIGVAAGEGSLALKSDGTVWVWGANSVAPLDDDRPRPAQVGGLDGVVAVAAGDVDNLALARDGTVWAWGWNEPSGGCTIQVSDDFFRSVPCRPTPAPVDGLENATAIAAGSGHNLALAPVGAGPVVQVPAQQLPLALPAGGQAGHISPLVWLLGGAGVVAGLALRRARTVGG